MLLTTFYLLLLTGCGFHLRGTTEATAWPTKLSRMQVRSADLVRSPLVDELRDRLRDRPGVELVDDGGGTPVLILSKERLERKVLAVDSTGKASDYLLRHQISFRVLDGAGLPMTEIQTIRLQRDYTFDATNVLAKEHEERELQVQMRRDLAERILRQVAALVL